MSVADKSQYYFFDTNVLVYAFDHNSPDKQRIAIELINGSLESQRGIISTQVVQEFISLALRKFTKRMTIPECREYLNTVLLPLCRYFPSISTYDQALGIVDATGYALYDALIITAAIESGCRILLTGDVQHGHKIQGLTILNPFAELSP